MPLDPTIMSQFNAVSEDAAEAIPSNKSWFPDPGQYEAVLTGLDIKDADFWGDGSPIPGMSVRPIYQLVDDLQTNPDRTFSPRPYTIARSSGDLSEKAKTRHRINLEQINRLLMTTLGLKESELTASKWASHIQKLADGMESGKCPQLKIQCRTKVFSKKDGTQGHENIVYPNEYIGDIGVKGTVTCLSDSDIPI